MITVQIRTNGTQPVRFIEEVYVAVHRQELLVVMRNHVVLRSVDAGDEQRREYQVRLGVRSEVP